VLRNCWGPGIKPEEFGERGFLFSSHHNAKGEPSKPVIRTTDRAVGSQVLHPEVTDDSTSQPEAIRVSDSKHPVGFFLTADSVPHNVIETDWSRTSRETDIFPIFGPQNRSIICTLGDAVGAL